MQRVDPSPDLIDRADHEPVVVFERARLVQRYPFDWREVARVKRSAVPAWIAIQPSKEGGASGCIDADPELICVDARAPVLQRPPL